MFCLCYYGHHNNHNLNNLDGDKFGSNRGRHSHKKSTQKRYNNCIKTVLMKGTTEGMVFDKVDIKVYFANDKYIDAK